MTHLPYTSEAADQLLGSLGSFWGQIFNDQGPYELMLAYALLDEQNISDLSRLSQMPYRGGATVTRYIERRLLRVTSEQVTSASRRVSAFGESNTFGGGLVYGEEVLTEYRVPLPDGIERVRMIVDHAVSPGFVWIEGYDYRIEDGHIVLDVDPFSFTSLTRGSNQARMWLLGVDERDDIYEGVHGYAVRAIGNIADTLPADRLASLTRALWDSMIQGPNSRSFRIAIASMAGCPIALSDETVDRLYDDAGGWVVVTDSRVYRLPIGVEPVVARGDILKAGDPLGDDLLFDLEPDGESLSAQIVPAVVLQPHHTAADISGPLVFFNETMATTTVTANGRTRLRVHIDGDADDIAAFWAAAEPDDGPDLLDLLQPGDEGIRDKQLPASANPAAVLLATSLAGAIAASVTVDGSADLSLAKQLWSPGTPVLLTVWVAASDELATMSDDAVELVGAVSDDESLSTPTETAKAWAG